MKNNSHIEQLSSKIIQHIQIPLIDQFLLELMSKSKDVSHLYSNDTKNLIKIMPFAVLMSSAILGLCFPYFYIVAAYFVSWTLIFGYRYKQLSDLFSTISKLQSVKDLIIAAIKENHSASNIEDDSKEDQYFKYVSVKYLVKNKNISGAEFFNIFSKLAKDLNYKPIDIKPFELTSSFFEKPVDNKITNELFQKIVGKKEDIETLEYLMDKPKQRFSYEDQIKIVESEIVKSKGVNINKAVGLESDKDKPILKPYNPDKFLLANQGNKKSTALNDEKETSISEANIFSSAMVNSIAAATITDIFIEKNHNKEETKIDEGKPSDESTNPKIIKSESIANKENREHQEQTSTNDDQSEQEDKNEDNDESFSLDDLDEIEDIDGFEPPEAEPYEEPTTDDDISDEIMDAIEKWKDS